MGNALDMTPPLRKIVNQMTLGQAASLLSVHDQSDYGHGIDTMATVGRGLRPQAKPTA